MGVVWTTKATKRRESHERVERRAESDQLLLLDLDLFHPEDREKVARHFQSWESGQSKEPAELRMLTPERVRWVEFVASPITYGEKPALYGVALDITNRRRAEKG